MAKSFWKFLGKSSVLSSAETNNCYRHSPADYMAQLGERFKAHLTLTYRLGNGASGR